MNHSERLGQVARETLHVFSEIAETAKRDLRNPGPGLHSLASSNGLTSTNAQAGLNRVSRENMEDNARLSREPAIARVVAVDEDDRRHVYYVARAAPGLRSDSRYGVVSYRTPLGRLAELRPGEWIDRCANGGAGSLEVVERALLRPEELGRGWDSLDSVLESSDRRVLVVPSLLDLLDGAGSAEDVEVEIERRIRAAVGQGAIRATRRRGIIGKMQLRDQAVLDRVQGEIFRMPLDSRLALLGPPGTGKTTTLIKRLGQKLDRSALDDAEKALIDRATGSLPHPQSWVMFTPTDLLRHYLKEAFSREGVPASDARVKTWNGYREELGRSSDFGILRTANGGAFVLRRGASHLAREACERSAEWSEEFDRWQAARFAAELAEAMAVIRASDDPRALRLARRLGEVMDRVSEERVVALVASLALLREQVRAALEELRTEADAHLKRALTRAQRNAKTSGEDFLASMTVHMATLRAVDEGGEGDDEGEGDAEDDESPADPALGDEDTARRLFYAALRLQARRSRSGRSTGRTRAAMLLDWIGDRGLSREEADEMSRLLAMRNALSRFDAPARRYLLRIPARYRAFRRDESARRWYAGEAAARDAHPFEVDLILLTMLRAARGLAADPRARAALDDPAFDAVRRILTHQRNQVLVDEASDFSPVQLACMRRLAASGINSFFICGDFDQRLTEWGVRDDADLRWVDPAMEVRPVAVTYRQSRQLRNFAARLRASFSEQAEPAALPDGIDNEAVPPVLATGLDGAGAVAEWLGTRLLEVERAVGPAPMPSVAVLVHDESAVHPLADALNEVLEPHNLRAVACVDGQIIGRDGEVRVFDVRHIKGLEFEAVFFVGVDRLAETSPSLFGRYLYVGATRAATYLGLCCRAALPAELAWMGEIAAPSWVD